MAVSYDAAPLVRIEHLKKYFHVSRGTVKSVDDVSFDIWPGETLGLVGESGCGKTTTGRTIVRLYEPTEGKILFEGQDLASMNQRSLLPWRKKIQMIFQDPYASLNPRMTVGDIVKEPMIIHGFPKDEWSDRVRHLLRTVGLNSEHANRYPHEFSGGQRQRIGIARSLAVEPEFIICDEPISALDVSIQAQIVNTLEDLQKELQLTYLFIAHDLSMVKHISDRIAVMYLGAIVELAESNELYTNPLHPYTRSLLSAIPVPDPDKSDARKRIILQGEIPSPLNPPSGCKFHTRCPHATERCSVETPAFVDRGGGHFSACHNM
ncbi:MULTISPECIES: ABC transporter ATP-binding protein [Jonquetella]|uniref:Oligopeptide/dipeptide ABC transporter, ATP-binding protein n=1 Tax=Jonquetella anthropi DSM 22815 TaxID=885272 RepID=H0ULE8_9BACT|nr:MULTISPECIES: oligopeptide/dipeptide ABC transporter ATP-binding protein [Jonquetella]EEX48070.1 ABC transporter, ATP-binding protein [Jonquetella anthropi E3_33 E1]EHM13507.1 oligopeptide/dipeptide ABC transporter, ATP-binding protein [Jonquetella anthropi DSM 22815]ERL24443.1 oligopeptide/dipeptide transporter, C-terminal domain protein [Jonquetella sp. BV3C21]